MIEGSIINNGAVDRILQRVWSFIAKEQWSKGDELLDKLLLGKPWDKKLLLNKAQLRKRMWMATDCQDYELLKQTLRLFSRCHLLTGSAEAGINTATLLLISGNEREAYSKANEVARHCRTLLMEGDNELDGYFAAIIGEANLIRGRLEAAQAWYETASSQDSSVTHLFKENMNILLNHIVPDSKSVIKIREALRA